MSNDSGDSRIKMHDAQVACWQQSLVSGGKFVSGRSVLLTCLLFHNHLTCAPIFRFGRIFFSRVKADQDSLSTFARNMSLTFIDLYQLLGITEKGLRAPRVTLMSLFAIRIWIQGIDQFGKLLYRILGSESNCDNCSAESALGAKPSNVSFHHLYQGSGQLSLNEGNSSYCFSGPLCLYQECVSWLFVDASHVAFYE